MNEELTIPDEIKDLIADQADYDAGSVEQFNRSLVEAFDRGYSAGMKYEADSR
jgi:hypothetical protein